MSDLGGPLPPEGHRILEVVLAIAKNGRQGAWVASSGDFAEHAGISQQTGSRWIIEAEEGGFITRQLGIRKARMTIEPKGFDLIMAQRTRLDWAAHHIMAKEVA